MQFDNLLMFKSSGNVSVSVSSTALKIYGTAVEGMAGRVSIQSSAETKASILPRYWISDDNSTYYLAATYPGGATTFDINAGGSEDLSGDLYTPVATDKKYIKEELVVAGTTATSFVMQSGLVLRAHADWTRAVGFE